MITVRFLPLVHQTPMTDPLPASLLRERPFVQFWIARFSTTIALHMQAVAVGWQMYAGLASALLTVGTAGGFLSREWILGTVFVVGVARTFEAPTTFAFLPALVPAALLPRAVAASSAVGQTGMIVGPAIGGLIYVVSPILVYALCCALFLAASILVFRVRVAPQTVMREPIDLARLFAGIAFIRGNPIVLGAIMLDLFAVLLGGATAL